MPFQVFPVDDPSIWQIGAGPPVGAPPADKEFHRDTTYPHSTYQPNAGRTAWEQITDDLSGKVYSLTPFAPFTRSPQQSDFAAALATDVAGAGLYEAGDMLIVETPDDGHFFFTRVAEDAAAPGTLTLLPMDSVIPSGREFTELPTNRATYHEGYRIDFGGVVYAMVNGSWFRMGTGVVASAGGGGGDVTTAAMNAAIAAAIAGSGHVDTAAMNTAIAAAITAEDILSRASMQAVLDDIPMQKLADGLMTTTEVNTYEAERTTQGV